MTVEWVHFPLHPARRPRGAHWLTCSPAASVDLAAMYAQMKTRMTAEGLPYGERTMTYNSRLAQELGKWADTQPGGDAIHDALFRAYFVEAPRHLPAVGSSGHRRARGPAGGRCPGGARAADVQGRRRRGLGAVAPYGITGVPTFVAGRYGVVGAQPYEALEELVQKAVPRDDSAR